MRQLSCSMAVSAALVLPLLWAIGASGATILFRNYHNPDSPTMRLLNERHLDGIIDGIVSYNVYLHETNKDTLFCLPSDSVITVQQADELIVRVARRLAEPDDVPISVLLIFGLRDAFPCS